MFVNNIKKARDGAFQKESITEVDVIQIRLIAVFAICAADKSAAASNNHQKNKEHQNHTCACESSTNVTGHCFIHLLVS
ncbi:hypothetical protein D3C78_1421010 [compost metagenome]